MDGTARLYDFRRTHIADVAYNGTVTLLNGSVVGAADTAGGGTVYGMYPDGRATNIIGKVDSGGSIYRYVNDGLSLEGSVSGKTVYSGREEVGRVEAQDWTRYITGITDVHRAGGALLLLIHLKLGVW